MNQENRVFTAVNLPEAVQAATESLQLPASCLKMEYVGDDHQGDITVEVTAVANENDRESLYQAELEPLYAMVNDLMRALDQQVEISHSIQEQMITLDLKGPTLDLFLNHHAELLGELQFLIARFFKSMFPRLVLEVRCDVNRFRANREEKLLAMVDETAGRLVNDGDSEILRPLNAYERRFVHLYFEDHRTINTDSLGDGQMKRIRLTYNSQPDPDDI